MKINKAILRQLGINIKKARLRRNISMLEIAQRTDLSLPTVRAIENGSPNTSIGAYLSVLISLGLEKDLAKVAYKDDVGQMIVDSNLGNRIKRGK